MSPLTETEKCAFLLRFNEITPLLFELLIRGLQSPFHLIATLYLVLCSSHIKLSFHFQTLTFLRAFPLAIFFSALNTLICIVRSLSSFGY